MKEIKTERILYECDFCGTPYRKKKTADRCERQHRSATCKHENVTFRVKRSKEYKDILLIKECADCITYHALTLSDLSSESLAKLWPLVLACFADQKDTALLDEYMRDPNGPALLEIFGVKT